MIQPSMLRITHTRGRMAPRVEHFAVNRLRLGSAPGSEVCFGASEGAGIAPLHAEIRLDGGVWQIVDRGAAAGTLVNHARIARKPLSSGDLVTLGGPAGPEFRIELVEPAPASIAAAPVPMGAPAAHDGRVDLPTAQRIVAEAVARASGDDPTASIVAAKVAEARRRASRHNLFLTLGILLTFAGMVAVGLTVWESQRRASVLTREGGLDRKHVERPKGEIPTKVYTAREVYEDNRAAVYLVGWTSGNKVGGVCTAFAIQPSVLATNAHCIAAFKEKGGQPVVTQNDSEGKVRFHILAAHMHPGYKGKHTNADAPDVGLIRIDGTMPKTTTLANDAELHALGPGDDVYVLGFPGRLMDPVSPSATFLPGHLGRLMALGEREPSGPGDAVLVQHDAVTRGGNSGSPIFNQYGHVIAIHAAHLDDEDDVQVGGRHETVVNASPYRVAMRIDLLKGVPAP